MPAPTMIWPTPRPAEELAVSSVEPAKPVVGVNVVVGVAETTPEAPAVKGLLMLTVPTPRPVMSVPGWMPAPLRTCPTARPAVEAVVIVFGSNAPVAVKLAPLRTGFTWSVVPR